MPQRWDSATTTQALFFVALLWAPHTRGAYIDYGVGYNGLYSTNTFRAAVDEQEEFTNRYDARLAIDEQSASLAARSLSSIAYHDYVNKTRSNRFYFTELAQATWFLRPGSMAWQFEDFFTQQVVDSTLPLTPGNVQDTNVFQTGPDFAFRLGSQDSLGAELRYGNYYYGVSAFGNQRYGGALRWLHLLTPNLNFSANLLGTSVDYEDDQAARDFNRFDLFWRGQALRGWNTVYVETGVTRIEQTDGDDRTGLFGGFAWDRVINSVSQLRSSFTAGFTDTGRDIREGAVATLLGGVVGGFGAPGLRGPGFGATGIGGSAVPFDTFLTGQIFYSEQADFAYLYTGTPLAGTLRVFGRKDDFDEPTVDRTLYGTLLNLRYDVTATVETFLFMRYARTEYDQLGQQAGRSDDNIEVGLTAYYLISPKLTFNIGTAWSERISTDPANEYDDFRAFIGLRYDSVPAF